jgi:hypothetical protein
MSDRIRTRWCDEPDQFPLDRFRIERDGDFGDLIELVTEMMTSRSAAAEIADVHERVIMTFDEARWVHRALGELLAAYDAEQAALSTRDDPRQRLLFEGP